MTQNFTNTDLLLEHSHPGRLHFDRGTFSLKAYDELDRDEPVRLFGLPLIRASLAETARAIVARAGKGERNNIQFINAHCINMLFTDPAYSRALSQAHILLPDGAGINLAARLAGLAVPNNLNGTDLFPHLCEEAALNNEALYLLGGHYGVAAMASKNMRTQIDGLHIAGTHHGYWNDDEESELIAAINASGATILLVGMGVPRQEIWIAKNRYRLNAPIIMGVGGLFDYYAGRIPRAPLALRNMGLEWIWRLMQEPRRMAKRYLIGNPHFVIRACRFAWAERGFDLRISTIAKRVFDLAFGLAALGALAPLFLAVAACIKIEDRGPLFFKQTRIGARGKPFRMWKFRSMAVDAEARRKALLAQSDRDNVCFKMKRDPRITGVGRWLRRMSIDELPQLINIVRGDMSIVGPRPALPQEVITYADRERLRLLGKPGLTCIWQVSGRAEIPFEQQVEMDIDYLERRSMLGDIKLIAKTVPAVASGKGAY